MEQSRAKYLLLEDSGSDVEIAFFDFTDHGLEIDFHVSVDAENALEYLFKDGAFRLEPPKAIFLDLHLPKMSGLDFLRMIRKDQQASQIPIVVMESSTSPKELEECRNLGVKRFIKKPLLYENFKSALRELSDNPIVTTLPNKQATPFK